jgi:hypothetical protein
MFLALIAANRRWRISGLNWGDLGSMKHYLRSWLVNFDPQAVHRSHDLTAG